MLFIAVIAGLAAVALAARWMQNQGGAKSRIAVATTDIAIGGRISPEMVRLADWPEGSVPAGAFVDGEKLDGRVVLQSVQRGEPLTEPRLAPVGTKGGLSAVVPAGKRAMTVRVNDVVGVAGFALPGTFVDVMVNTQVDHAQRGDGSISKIVLERILVLAVAQESDRDATKPVVVNAVTLEVTPRDAEILDLARSVGTLSLVLRNQTDAVAQAAGNGATKTEMLTGLPEAPAASAPAPAPVARAPRPHAPVTVATAPAPNGNCVEVIRGLSKVIECF
jgi:pilus assembly protein CpaB